MKLPVVEQEGGINPTRGAMLDLNTAGQMGQVVGNIGQQIGVYAEAWQKVQNASEQLAGKNDLEEQADQIIKEATDYSGWSSSKDIQTKQADLNDRMGKLLGNITNGFANDRNKADFQQKYQHQIQQYQNQLDGIFRSKYIDNTNATLLRSAQRNKDAFISSGDEAFRQSYMDDIGTAYSAGFITEAKHAQLSGNAQTWNYDYAINQATSDPEGTLANLGRFGLNADQTYDVERRANAILSRKKAQLKKGRTEEEALEIADKQTSNAIMIESELSNIKDLKKDKPVERILHNLELQDNIQNMTERDLSDSDYKKYRKEATLDLIQAVKNEADIFDDAWIQESAMSTGLQAMKNDGKIGGKAWSDDMSVVMIRDFYAMAKEKGLDLRATDSSSRDRAKEIASKAISNTIERVSGGYGKEYNSVFLNGKKVSKARITDESERYENNDYTVENGKKIYTDTGIEVELD